MNRRRSTVVGAFLALCAGCADSISSPIAYDAQSASAHGLTITLMGPMACFAGTATVLVPTVSTPSGHALSTSRLSWASSNATVATVDDTGRVSCLAPGNSTVTASFGNATGRFSVFVVGTVDSDGDGVDDSEDGWPFDPNRF